MIAFIRFDVQLHGLALETEQQMDELRVKIKKAIQDVHPSLRFDGDVEVEIEEHAGNAASRVQGG